MKIRNILMVIILLMVLSITVGFSAFVSEMSISNIVADVRIVEDVRITNVEFLSSESVGVNPVDLSYDKDSVLGRLSFDSISSAAVYKITVTNFGNADVYFKGMNNISPVRVEFVDGGADVTISSLGGTYEFTITVFQIEHSDYESDFKVDFDFKRLFNVSYENVDKSNESVVEGENYYTYLNVNYDLSEVKIFMGGRELTADEVLYDGNSITIYNVSGDVVFKCPETLNSIMQMNSVLDTNVSFASSSGLDTVNNVTYTRNGTQNDTYPVYYYRGNVTANNVIFGDYCWKMVRTTETGGVKMIYNGVPAEDGSCDNTGTASQIGTSSFNDAVSNGYASPVYVGYMYGTVYTVTKKTLTDQTDTYLYGNDVNWDGTSYTLADTTPSSSWATDYKTLATKYHYTCFNTTGTCTEVYYINYFSSSSSAYYLTLKDGKDIEDVKEEMFVNTTDSKIKTVIDSWYASNMTGYTNMLEDTVWCNDRTITSGPLYSKDANSTGSSYFGAYSRNIYPIAPSLTCPEKLDSFTVSSSKGNGSLIYPVGLLTADEYTLAGSGNKGYSTTSYLHTGQYQWSLSPHAFRSDYAQEFYLSSSGTLDNYFVINASGVRPSVSLKLGTLISGGDGSVSSPYRIKATFTINGSKYYYEPGMTWYEWLMSDYAGFSVTFMGDEKDSQMMNDVGHLRDDHGFVLSSYKIDSSLNYRFYDSGGSGD